MIGLLCLGGGQHEMKLHSSALRLSQRLFLWLGMAALAYFLGTAAYAGLYQRYQNWKFEQRQLDIPDDIKPDTRGTYLNKHEGDLSVGMRARKKLCAYPG